MGKKKKIFAFLIKNWIILASLFFGLLICFLDAFINASFIEQQDFLDNLIHPSSSELIMRVLVAVMFVCYGLVVELKTEKERQISKEKESAIEQRNQAIIDLEKSKKELEALAFGIAHDLKSPAVGIYGLTRLLHQKYHQLLDETGRAYCDQILKTAEMVADLVRDINIYIHTQKIPLVLSRVDIKKLLQAVKDEISPEIMLRRRLDWHEADFPEIVADRLSLMRVFRNLIDNALKYCGQDVKITVEYMENEKFHIFAVTDNGPGIKEEHQEIIFDMFSRAESSRGTEGTGIGLANVKAIVEKHGGWVEIESNPEKGGTTFNFSISRNLKLRDAELE